MGVDFGEIRLDEPSEEGSCGEGEGTIEAVVPRLVPTIQRVKGMSATMRMAKGNERPILTTVSNAL